MDNISNIVTSLQKIRKIPQFIIFKGIGAATTIQVREKILEYIKKNPTVNEVDVIIDSSGGSADDAYRIIRTLRNNFKTVNIVIPFWAKSAATLLALGGSRIIMDEFGEFGPLDTQLRDDDDIKEGFKSALIDEYALETIEKRAQQKYQVMVSDILNNKIVKISRELISQQILSYTYNFYRPLLEKIDPYEIGVKARKLAIGEQYLKRILVTFNKSFGSAEVMKEFVDYVVHGCPDHGYILDYSIISLYLSNVFTSRSIGKSYHEELTKLSTFLFKSNVDWKLVGFVDEIVRQEKENKEKLNKQNKK